jgi:hypothetical protein
MLEPSPPQTSEKIIAGARRSARYSVENYRHRALSHQGFESLPYELVAIPGGSGDEEDEIRSPRYRQRFGSVLNEIGIEIGSVDQRQVGKERVVRHRDRSDVSQTVGGIF